MSIYRLATTVREKDISFTESQRKHELIFNSLQLEDINKYTAISKSSTDINFYFVNSRIYFCLCF